jgi:hypothetical protein
MKNYKLIMSFFLIYIFFLPVQSSQTIILNQLNKTDNLKDADLLEKNMGSLE